MRIGKAEFQITPAHQTEEKPDNERGTSSATPTDGEMERNDRPIEKVDEQSQVGLQGDV